MICDDVYDPDFRDHFEFSSLHAPPCDAHYPRWISKAAVSSGNHLVMADMHLDKFRQVFCPSLGKLIEA